MLRSSLPDNQEEIRPDAAYGKDCRQGPSIPLISKNHKGSYSVEQLRIAENRLTKPTSGRVADKDVCQGPTLQGEVWCHKDRCFLQEISKCPDTYSRSRSSTLKSSGDSTSLQDDRCSNGKHSDSGYDTLQAGRAVPGFTELLKFQNTNINPRKSSELVYPVHEVQCGPSQPKDTGKDKEGWDLKQNESQWMFSHQYAGGSKHKGEGSKDITLSCQFVESPPKNIVQSRIKAFEVGNEGDESMLVRESLQMQEPLKMSPPMYHPNEAHVSSLKNTEKQQSPAEESLRRRRKSDLCAFVFGDSGSSSKENSTDVCSRSRENTSEYEKHTKSVRDLLADFERKSQLVKERQAAEEEQSSEGGPGKRCVFSDTETLLYDTSSDAEGQFGDVKQTTEVCMEQQRVECRAEPVCSDEGEEDKDEEVATALGRREGFFSSCRDLGRNRDSEYCGNRRYRKRKNSKTSLTVTNPTASEDLEIIVTPGYLRLSMAESLVTHEDSDSVCGTPTNSQQCKSPGESPDTNKDKQKVNSGALENVEEHYMPMTPSKKAVLAPPDAFSNARSPSASQTVIMENIFGGGGCEESSYVEMTDGVVRSLLAPECNRSLLSKFDLNKVTCSESTPTYATPESPRYCEIGSDGKENSGVTCHYEFLYKASTQYEPVYMEVSPLREALKVRDKFDITDTLQGEGGQKKENSGSSSLQDSSEKSKSGEENVVEALPPTPPRTSLPDILNSASTSSQQKSDRESSDADDEASKDLDSLDTPRHPRFSLSDTFRPASYYLGASSVSDRALMVLGSMPTSTVEQHDSSDSDLVSPPPIPTSPLPLDDFDNSLEPHDASLDAKKLSPTPSKAGSESESNEKEESKMWSSPSGHTIEETSDSHESLVISPFLPKPVYGSGDIHCSGNKSVYSRNEQGSQSTDSLLKRRPLSDDVFGGLDVSEYVLPSPYVEHRTYASDLESVGSRNGVAVDLDEGVSIDLDQYIEDLQARDAFSVDTFAKDANYDHYRTYRNEMHGLNANSYKVPQKIQQSDNTKRNEALGDSNLNYCLPERDQAVRDTVQPLDIINNAVGRDSNGSHPCHSEESSSKRDEVQYENLQNILLPPPEHSNGFIVDVAGTTSLSDGTIAGSDRNSSTVEALGVDAQHAPYYYSDLLKGEEDGFASSTSERSVNSSRGQSSFVSAPSASRNQPLNNQRGDLIETSLFVKRNDIGRKVNAIHQSPGLISATFPQHVPPNEDENRRLAEELRSSTVHFLGAANKRGHVDERNLYEADTIQRRKAIGTPSTRGSSLTPEHRYRSQTPDFYGITNTVNLYPYGLRDKSSLLKGSESGRHFPHQPQRRSRSLEGLIEGPDILGGYNEPQSTLRSPRINRMLQSSELTVSLTNVPHAVAQTHRRRNDMEASVPAQYRQDSEGDMRNRTPPSVPEETGLGPCEGDDLWEEDVLWRESLRRVSLRHTRSLDNLDGERGVRSNSRLSNASAATTSTMEQSGPFADRPSGEGCVRQKVTRDVTYVNDSMMRNSHYRLDPLRQKEYEDYREGRRRTRRRTQQMQGPVSDDVAAGMEQDDGVHYERLSRYSESLERTRRGQTYLEGYIWDEDKETFRKHHTEPVTTQQQYQSQQKQRFLEDGSLPPQPPPPQPPPSFEIDREKLRQWDLMSSAPLLQQQMLGVSTGTRAGARQSVDAGVVVVGAERAETLSDTGGRRQQQQKPWNLLDLTVLHADETDPMREAAAESRPHSSAGEYACADV
jgi:hypothetical protein